MSCKNLQELGKILQDLGNVLQESSRTWKDLGGSGDIFLWSCRIYLARSWQKMVQVLSWDLPGPQLLIDYYQVLGKNFANTLVRSCGIIAWSCLGRARSSKGLARSFHYFAKCLSRTWLKSYLRSCRIMARSSKLVKFAAIFCRIIRKIMWNHGEILHDLV